MTLSPSSSVRGGFPLGLTGATAATRYVGATASGAPASGTFAVGDFCVDQSGSLFVCTVAGSPGTWVEAGAGSGLTELFNSTLGADAASIDTGAGGFATTHRALLILFQGRTTEAAVISSVILQFNADTAGNYDTQDVKGRNATASAADAQAAIAATVRIAGASAATGVAGAFLCLIPAYGATTLEKAGICITGFADEAAAGGTAEVIALHWRNTAAISRILFTAGSGNLLAGTSVTVFGVG